MNDFAKDNWKDGESIECDITAFDSSQQGESVALQDKIMARYNIPDFYQELYRHFKLDSTSNIIGPVATKRTTGEPGTYDENCRYNEALQAVIYDIPVRMVQLIGGDDSATNGRPPESVLWQYMRRFLRAECKTVFTTHPTFCGWKITQRGIYKDPILLFLKLQYHIANDHQFEVLDSYAHEASTGYTMGDTLYDYCSFEELQALQWLMDYFHQHLQSSVTSKLFSYEHTRTLPLLLTDLLCQLAGLGDSRRENKIRRSLESRVLTLKRRLIWGFSF
jgi:hypothetical protein